MSKQTTNSDTVVKKRNQIRVNHDDFQKFSIREGRYKRRSVHRTHGVKEDQDGFKQLIRLPDLILEPRVSVYPEFAAFTFHLEGCPRNLLTYIIFYELNVQKGTFKFDPQVIDRFKEYSGLFKKSYKESAIKQGLRTLVEKNIVINQRRGFYLMNPLLVGGTSEAQRRELIRGYTEQIKENKKDTILEFFPKCDPSL